MLLNEYAMNNSDRDELINLLKSPRWTNPIDLFIGTIIEYDMVDGGLSIIKEEKLLSQIEIDRIQAIPKGIERNAAVGKLKYSKDESVRNIGKQLEQLFYKYRVKLALENQLTINDIFSIKRDALFLTKPISQTEFGIYIKYAYKHEYDIYIMLGQSEITTNYNGRHKTLEVYYNKDKDDLAIKGISNEKLALHNDFIVTIIKRYLIRLISFDYIGATEYIVKVINDYKRRKLPVGYYREFNDESLFPLQIGNTTTTEYGEITTEYREFKTEYCDENNLRYVDIRYNFNYVLVPMLNLASLGIGK